MRSTTAIAAVTAATLSIAACGGNDGATRAMSVPTPAPTATAPAEDTTTNPITTSSPTDPPTTIPNSTVPPTTIPEPTVPPTTSNDDAWREQAEAGCAHWLPVAALPAPAADQASLDAHAQALVAAWESAPDLGVVDVPPGPGRTGADLDAYLAGAQAALDAVVAGAAAGDQAATVAATDRFLAHLAAIASAFAAGGQSCGPWDADRVAEAALNVTMVAPWQVETGYGSVWVSQSHQSGVNNVMRIDPATGATIATIEMPSRPGKLQPADGLMHVRTDDSYVVIDSATNIVVGRLMKTDVGPNADRSWAVDGALWICDGQRLHRYDPVTLAAVTVIELGIDCGHPYATSDLVTAWTYDEAPGASAAFVDPQTNALLGIVELGGNSTVPVVLDGTVFFPPALGSIATVVDRATWTVTATPDLGRYIDGGSQGAFDGTSIYVIADKPTGTIAVIDPTTFQVSGEVRTVAMPTGGLNSLAATRGVLWSVSNGGQMLQRFTPG